ncbi:MAG TPA: AAA family ATPase [Acidimicrobiales bacterium]|nr:AAA family ATPase [Acidimicrobiales bacterium]
MAETAESLEQLARSVGRPLGPLAHDVAIEAYNIAAAFVDADDTQTDDELAALIHTFGPRLDTDLSKLRPPELRRTKLVTGKHSWITTPSALFSLLIDADRKGDTRLAWRYYDDAMHIAHAACALDTLTTDEELDALEQFRTTLLGAMEAAGLRNPWTGRTPLTGRDAPAKAAKTTPEPPQLPEARPIEQLLAELDAMIGLAEVKAQVRLVTNLIRVGQLRHEHHLPVPETSHHLVFTGNPGTGKTTVARLVAQIYRTLGVLEKGQLVETDRAGLVAGYVGQTALKTTAVFQSASGGLLLIDEAYALAEGDFGQEAIDTLVKLIEDQRGKVVVIVAGYPDEMTEFLDANPGLRSRFPRSINFPDYTTDELVGIFETLCHDNSYSLSAEARDRVRAVFDAEPRGKGFGNGRLARNLFEAAMGRQATRIVELTNPSDADLCRLTEEDIGSPGSSSLGPG